ncbi:hypothetical protein JTE90_016195 [Oedothorax gibbosus]|uniref:Uncharacterized protein n=1 Tax=Oedothorax gibbosus TaxID=931172 RepID=A0AAV6TGM3_9ARAC|nr:hypothetical protein JTE90_016195 [Oedothorax gibbosus]
MFPLIKNKIEDEGIRYRPVLFPKRCQPRIRGVFLKKTRRGASGETKLLGSGGIKVAKAKNLKELKGGPKPRNGGCGSI